MSRRFLWRLYSDFIMPSRLSLYEQLLREARDRGYELHSVASFWEVIKAGGPAKHTRYLILRHDVDTDVKTAKAMFSIENKLGGRASYYFRLSTIDVAFMKEIHLAGAEASYHYEEIAAIGKQQGFDSKEQVYLSMEQIRQLFIKNYLALREQTGLPLHTVASHGDFFNRRVGIANSEILACEEVRQQLGIELETYDENMMRYVTSRHSDTLAPHFWKPDDPLAALQKEEPVVYVLTHPRHWQADVPGNLLDDGKRLWEEICYQLRKTSSYSLLPGGLTLQVFADELLLQKGLPFLMLIG
ncbi:hypothetical protein NDK47_07555 [Brevibacillus ruminantium]|uniref:Polysaccharide deacetylase n=1 Tax=Brevibacillus ruminantium TaxID=2950604 RepID=A0ABY4WJ32_9BACL|nr:hypothetical protein [Brevibacillus ruminantium]USG67138.1 hypothetical protein NDK47_07555 [Brevibacillus ruminantium]